MAAPTAPAPVEPPTPTATSVTPTESRARMMMLLAAVRVAPSSASAWMVLRIQFSEMAAPAAKVLAPAPAMTMLTICPDVSSELVVLAMPSGRPVTPKFVTSGVVAASGVK